VGGTGEFAAVEAVAEGLEGDGVSVWSVNGRLKGCTVKAGSPSRV
jgi:hypothetical protein